MRTIVPLIITVAIFSTSCVNQSEYDSIKSEYETIKKQAVQDSICISNLRDTIAMLSQPADQRLASINKLVSDGDFDKARKEIHELNILFPNSIESQKTKDILQRIDNLIEKQRAEEERIKAMGFKSLKPISSATIGYNKVSFSGISIGQRFVHDSYDDSYFYSTADRGNVYVTAAMAVTSTSKDPEIPSLAVYSIDGDKMHLEGTMRIELAHWKDYGTYLGNYHDNGNDFSKTSTVRFKLGAEVSADVVKEAYAIVLKKENFATRHYARYDNPPISYSGSSPYLYNLELSDFTGNDSKYVVIKIANL